MVSTTSLSKSSEYAVGFEYEIGCKIFQNNGEGKGPAGPNQINPTKKGNQKQGLTETE